MSISGPTIESKIKSIEAEPSLKPNGTTWFQPSTKYLKISDGSNFNSIKLHSDSVDISTSSTTESLTNYLNDSFSKVAKLYIDNTFTGKNTFSSISFAASSDITISSIVTSIPDTPDDTTLPTTKLLNDSLSLKQDTLTYYSENTTDSIATISASKTKLNGKVEEGSGTSATGSNAHAEGSHTTASGTYSHAEGYNTTASGNFSHAEGSVTTASSNFQHAQGKYNIEDANDKYADIIGNGFANARSNAATVSWDGISWSQTDVRAGGTDQDAATHSLVAKQNITDNTLETTDKTVPGAINEVNTTLSNKQDKLLYYSETSGDTPSATISVASINFRGRVAEGSNTTASAIGSHAEGYNTTTSGDYSHAEGFSTTASATGAHAEGYGVIASSAYSHAEGASTTASGNWSHAEGGSTTASGNFSHAEGSWTIASSAHQHAQGKYNIEDAENKYADIIGNGTSNYVRSNAATVSWDGISWSQTDVRAGGVSDVYPMYSFSYLYNYLNKLYFIGSGGGLSFSTNPCANVFSRSYFFTFIVPEDWDTTSTIINANRPLNVIGDIYYSGGYQGFSVRITNTGEMYGIAGRTSGSIYVSSNTPVGTLFNGTSSTVIPKGIYRCVATLTITDSNFSGKFFVNGQLVSSRSTTDLTTSNFVPGTIFAIGNSGNYNFFEFDQSKLGCNMCDIGVVNFDMSDESAPYTVSDYSAYSRPNPSLRNPASSQKLLLELNNYTITQSDSTIIINDISKNNCNATVVGNVSGDQDSEMSILLNQITATS